MISRNHISWVLLSMLTAATVGCGGDDTKDEAAGPSGAGAGSGSGAAAAGGSGAGAAGTGASSAGAGAGTGGTGGVVVFNPGDEPTEAITPKLGELTIIQVFMPAGITARLGEAAILVGPDGTITLLDVGNTNHDDDIRDAVRALNTTVLPANGFPARDPLQVDWIVVTHVHGDHSGAIDQLLVTTDEPLTGVRGIVHRGFVDIGAGLTETRYEELCNVLRGPFQAVDIPLCVGAEVAPCDPDELAGTYNATGCPGLHLGDLGTAADDAAKAPSYLDLGGGAKMTFFLANGHASDGTTVIPMAPFGHVDTNEENARSLGGVVSYGEFRYHFGGDITGTGEQGEPDVETHVATVSAPHHYGALGADVTHTHHHARRTSNNQNIVDALAPKDGRSRNAIAGINAIHVGSPHQEVLDVWMNDNRMGDGWFWVTESTITSGDHARLKNADDNVILQTIQGGVGYRVQAAGSPLFSQAYPAVRHP